MAHTDVNRHHQPWGVPCPGESSPLVEASPEEFMTSQLERVAAALNKLEARLDAAVLRVGATQATPQPIPAAPFSALGLESGYYPRPEPDPPDRPPLNATAQPRYAPYQPPFPPHQPYTWQQQPPSSDPYRLWYQKGPIQTLPATQPRQPTSWDLPEQHQHQSYRPFNRLPSRPPTCWDPPRLYTPHDYTPSDQPPHNPYLAYDTQRLATIGEGRSNSIGDFDDYWDSAESRSLSRPYLCHDPSSSLLPTAAVVPPPPLQHPSSWSPTSPNYSVALLPAAVVVPPLNMSPLAPPCSPDISGEEGELLENLLPPSVISPSCIPNVSGGEKTLLDDEKVVDSVDKVKTVITSFDVARVASQDVENCLVEKGGVYLYALDGNKVVDVFSICLKEIAFLYKDLHGGDVARMNHQPTLLDGDARLIPPRNDTLCLSVLGRVDKLSILALNFDNHIGPPLMIFHRDDEGRRFPIRCAFDPGGNSSPKLLFVKLFIVSWFPP